MANYQITCITKPNTSSKHEHITHVGGPAFGKKPRETVVMEIDNKINTYFTQENGNHAWVGTVDGPTGKYLRTYADGRWNDNLLSLPQC